MSGTPPAEAAPAATDYQYDPKGLIGAAATLDRVTSILGLRAGGGAADEGASVKVRLSRLSSAYRDARQHLPERGRGDDRRPRGGLAQRQAPAAVAQHARRLRLS